MFRSGVHSVRSPVDRRLALASVAGYVALGAVAARDPGPRERLLFRRVNEYGGALTALRVPQQLGTPWTLPTIALFGFASHRPQLGVTATLALPVEKALEVGLKLVAKRSRPAQVTPRVELQDDAPVEGPSYPSGHAAIACTVVVLTAPYVHPVVTALGATSATATAVTRVHQGAHFPMDAVGGALLGLAVGCGLRAVFGAPAR